MQGLPKIIANIAMIAARNIAITTCAMTEMHVLSLVIMEEMLDLMITREVHISLTIKKDNLTKRHVIPGCIITTSHQTAGYVLPSTIALVPRRHWQPINADAIQNEPMATPNPSHSSPSKSNNLV
jgi:hypothetical protein